MANSEEFDISKSRTFLSRLAFDAASICSLLTGCIAVASEDPRVCRDCRTGREGSYDMVVFVEANDSVRVLVEIGDVVMNWSGAWLALLIVVETD